MIKVASVSNNIIPEINLWSEEAEVLGRLTEGRNLYNMELKKSRKVSNVSCMTTGTHIHQLPLLRQIDLRKTTRADAPWPQRWCRAAPTWPPTQGDDWCQSNNAPVWGSLRADPDGRWAVDVFAVLRRKASHQMPPRTGSTQGRWWQEPWRLSEPTIWSSAFELGCFVCVCVTSSNSWCWWQNGVCWHVLPGSPGGRRHRLPAGLSFCSISCYFFLLHHEEMIGCFRSIVDVRGRAGWGGQNISIHGQMLCQEHHPSKKRTGKICI